MAVTEERAAESRVRMEREWPTWIRFVLLVVVFLGVPSLVRREYGQDAATLASGTLGVLFLITAFVLAPRMGMDRRSIPVTLIPLFGIYPGVVAAWRMASLPDRTYHVVDFPEEFHFSWRLGFGVGLLALFGVAAATPRVVADALPLSPKVHGDVFVEGVETLAEYVGHAELLQRQDGNLMVVVPDPDALSATLGERDDPLIVVRLERSDRWVGDAWRGEVIEGVNQVQAHRVSSLPSPYWLVSTDPDAAWVEVMFADDVTRAATVSDGLALLMAPPDVRIRGWRAFDAAGGDVESYFPRSLNPPPEAGPRGDQSGMQPVPKEQIGES